MLCWAFLLQSLGTDTYSGYHVIFVWPLRMLANVPVALPVILLRMQLLQLFVAGAAADIAAKYQLQSANDINNLQLQFIQLIMIRETKADCHPDGVVVDAETSFQSLLNYTSQAAEVWASSGRSPVETPSHAPVGAHGVPFSARGASSPSPQFRQQES